jgi:hypothetical protein
MTPRPSIPFGLRPAAALPTLLLALVLSGGCADTRLTHPVSVASRDQAAAVLLSVSAVAPWEQVAEAVQPSFALTGDQALQQVAPVTQRIQEQVLSAFGVSLGLGLPQSSSASSITRTESGTTSTTTSTTQPGVVPPAPSGIPAGGQLPPGVALTGDAGLDPILKYQAAAALYQAVQLMNREVQLAASRRCFMPYLVRLKLTVVPYRRNLPYDLHARISFFSDNATLSKSPSPQLSQGSPEGPLTIETRPASPPPRSATSASKDGCDNAKELPQVLPLLVTDDLERALKLRAVETARQIGLALSFMYQGVGGSLGANRVTQALDAISGQDINTRLTVTRLSDNTLYTRIGAAYQATAGAALVGQTNDISLILLVPRGYFGDDAAPAPSIDVYAFTEFRDAIGGTVLGDRPASSLLPLVDAALERVIGGRYPDVFAAWRATPVATRETIARKLAGAIQRSHYGDFAKVLSETQLVDRHGTPVAVATGGGSSRSLGEAIVDYHLAFWTSLTGILADSPFKTAFVELPRPPSIVLPEQTALVLDDTKDRAQVHLQSLRGLPNRWLVATLAIKTKDTPPQARHLVPQAIGFDPATRVLTLTFPSPARWGLAQVDAAVSELLLAVNCPPTLLCGTVDRARFPVSYATPKAADAAPGVSATAEVTQIVAKDGAGSAVVTVDKLEDDHILLTVTGAEVRAVTDAGGARLPVAKRQVKVLKGQAGPLTFELFNLHRGGSFAIEVEGFRGTTSTGKKTMAFTVLDG